MNGISQYLMHFAMIIALCVFSLFDYFPANTFFLVLACALAMPYLALELCLKYEPGKNYAIFLLSFFFIGSILNLLSTGNGIGGSFVVLGTFSVGLYCVHHYDKLRWFLLFVLVVNICYIIHGLIITDGNANEIYEGAGLSRNHPGFLLVLWIAFYSYILKLNNKKFDLIIPILAVVVSFFLEGRSSLAIILIITFVLLIEYNKSISIFVGVLLLLLVIVNWDNIMALYELSSFESNGVESARFEIWPTYFSEMTFPWLVFGVDTMSIHEIAKYAGNPHNTFLNMHSRMGLLAVIAFFSVLILSTYEYIKRKQYICLFFLYMILARVFFDSELFISPYDYVVYFMLLYPIYPQTSSITRPFFS